MYQTFLPFHGARSDWDLRALVTRSGVFGSLPAVGCEKYVLKIAEEAELLNINRNINGKQTKKRNDHFNK